MKREIIIAVLLAGLLAVSIIGGLAQKEAYENQTILSPIPDQILPGPEVKEESVEKFRSVYLGEVSYYNEEYCQKHNPGCLTASGDRFSDSAFTGACADFLPLNARVRITRGQNSVQIICNDRGNFSEKYSRIADLSQTAFEELAATSAGVIKVKMEVLE